MMFGPQIAFIDDEKSQIIPLERAISNFHTGSIYINASPESDDYPSEPIESVKLLFLDLHYGGIKFDPYLCVEWVSRIIPSHSKYILVIWSKDIDKKEELLSVLAEGQLSPTYFEAWQKTDFDINTFDFKAKIDDLINSASDNKKIGEVIYGQVLEIEEDGFLVNCLLNMKKPTFQVRKFDNELFKGIKGVEIGNFIRILVSTELGARKIEIFSEPNDLSQKFKVVDYFEGLKDTAFFIEDND
ncbi:hypothetical protein M2T82_00960 [Elizabethkingia ursingii]|uniref:hypothetical protein n=1 Tax=Elizabethkingia ursingii TaxID=1756150 RepID=UPI002011F60A|nr:hypothetical protein [Elizabethkingia ursingii]MCL1666622.1 hypothetical protein [Elizabethkingia ursingii]